MTSRVLTAAVAGLAAITISVLAQNRVNDGRVQVSDERQTLNRGRLGTQESMPYSPLTLTGTLVDASCRDRSEANLRQTPIPLAEARPAETPQEAQAENAQRARTGYATGKSEPKTPGITAHGITVDPQTLEREQADVMAAQTPDRIGRHEDETCAVTALTTEFALLMDNGRLLNLDGGGNTFALQAVQSTSKGQAMLNGKLGGIKPRVTIKGNIRGDHLTVESLKLG